VHEDVFAGRWSSSGVSGRSRMCEALVVVGLARPGVFAGRRRRMDCPGVALRQSEHGNRRNTAQTGKIGDVRCVTTAVRTVLPPEGMRLFAFEGVVVCR